MTDLSTILPHYTPRNSRLYSLLETYHLTTSDLLTLDPVDISRRCTDKRNPNASPDLVELKHFIGDVIAALHADIKQNSGTSLHTQQSYLTIGDRAIDALLNGGIPTGALTEFVGESGAGKTQFLLTLTLTAQLPRSAGGLARGAIYISTEAPLSTPRLVQIAASLNARFAPAPAITTDRVLSITCNDLETQDHILRYQLAVAVERHDIGLVVIDSIAANFRAEHDRPGAAKRVKMGEGRNGSPGPAQMARRGGELVTLAQRLRELARRYDVAVVVANQVSDRFQRGEGWEEEDVMALDYQSRWFTGWGGADGASGEKVPALGLVWANLLAGRVVLKKVDEDGQIKRRMEVVFANWVEAEKEKEYEIWEGGVRAVEEGTEHEERADIYEQR